MYFQRAITITFLAVIMPSTPSDSFAASQDSSKKITSNNELDETRVNDQAPLQLPPVNPNNVNKDIKTLKFGEAMKLDEMGPIIINTDGTTRRIDNWDILTEREQEVTWRRIKKRNAERRKMLEEKDNAQNEG
uniref:RxLR effector protein n=1 Tax=Chaetoceros debilis TaxID=122233 RepID=A0A7S3V470_9STRA|mmetsp:Transcript_16037/g.24036  ORF Transcript_16037/g.24036 Transcript_16037/m.24036 type:complete len:133 (+) Transcript_16037:82-480(+)